MTRHQTLPDYIKSELDIVFVGINPGTRSAEVGHHYAGHSNRFWRLLKEAKLVPCVVSYQDDWRLPEWGLGLTNIVGRTTSSSRGLARADYVAGRAALVDKIRQYHPRILALLGMTLYPIVFPNRPLAGTRHGEKSPKVQMGLLPEFFEGVRVVLLPNPSGRNAHYTYHDMLNGFLELKQLQKSLQKSVRFGHNS